MEDKEMDRVPRISQNKELEELLKDARQSAVSLQHF